MLKKFFFLTLLIPQAAFACLFHASLADNELYAPSGADWTVLRALNYQDKYQLNPIENLDGNAGFRRATSWLKLFSQQIEKQGVSSTYIYLADVGMWSYYDNSETVKITFEVTPERESTYIVLTQMALSNLISENMTFDEALTARLMFSNQQDITEALKTNTKT